MGDKEAGSSNERRRGLGVEAVAAGSPLQLGRLPRSRDLKGIGIRDQWRREVADALMGWRRILKAREM